MTISRMFTATDDAMAAVDELNRAGFERVGIHVFAPNAGAPDVAAIARQGVPRLRAETYAARVRAGETLVIVNAPLGFGTQVTQILERGRPGDTLSTDVTYELPIPDRAAPFSSAIGMPALSKNPAPLSTWLKIPTLTRRQNAKVTSFGMKLLSDEPTPLSAALGMKVLSDAPAPLSSAAGMKTLLQEAAPLSSRIGMNTLSQDPAPLSSRVGMKPLSHEATPLSKFFNWPTLSRDPAPLSSLLGWRVLAKRDTTPP